MSLDSPVVVDASLAVKWVVNEEFTDRSRTLVADCARAERAILAPPHITSEVTNALFQRTRRRDNLAISTAEAEEALARFLDFRVTLVNVPELYPRAFAFARRHDLSSTYDSLYVVLAKLVGADLWTDDRVLLRSLREVAPWVRWIGDYAPGSD